MTGPDTADGRKIFLTARNARGTRPRRERGAERVGRVDGDHGPTMAPSSSKRRSAKHQRQRNGANKKRRSHLLLPPTKPWPQLKYSNALFIPSTRAIPFSAALCSPLFLPHESISFPLYFKTLVLKRNLSALSGTNDLNVQHIAIVLGGFLRLARAGQEPRLPVPVNE